MSRKKNVSFFEHLDDQFGPQGAKEREIYENGFQAFMLGVMIQEGRKKMGMTQTQLAEKCGTTKTYISRVENNSSDVRLSTLIRIINKGLGGKLDIRVTW